jgi:hypothetical protein
VHLGGGVLASAGLENVVNPNKEDPKSKYVNDLVRFVLRIDFKNFIFVYFECDLSYDFLVKILIKSSYTFCPILECT